MGCDLSWFLQRRAKLPGTTYFSTLAGSVAHERLEHRVIHGAYPEESIADHLDRLIAEHLDGTPFTEADIRTSRLPAGLKVADHPNRFDRGAVVAIMPTWLGKWETWFKTQADNGWKPWAGEGDTGAEVGVRFELGGHPVIGSIDLVMHREDDDAYALWDYKFGASRPDSTAQLDGYRIGFKETYGLDASWAGFYFGRTGKEDGASYPSFTKRMLDEKFREAGERALAAEAGDFRLDMTKCQYLCGVEWACPVRHPDAGVVELPFPVVRG